MIKNFTKKILFILPIIFVIISNISFAQTDGTENIKKLGDNITSNVVGTATTLLMTAAFMIFFYGVVVFIYGRATNTGDMKDLAKGREFMLWGLAALFVMVSVSGIIKLFQTSLDINGSNIDIKPVSFSYSGSSSSSDSNSSNNGNSTNGVSGGNSGSLAVENPFANTANFPVIRVGANDTLKGGAGGDKPIIDLLFKLLQKKKCISSSLTGLGTTYDQDPDANIVKAFQKVNGISPADGVVGKVTWEVLSVETGQTTVNSKILVKDCTAPVQ